MIVILGLGGFFLGLLVSDGGAAYFRAREQRKIAAANAKKASRLAHWWSGVPAEWHYEAKCDWYTAGPYQYRSPRSCPNARNEPYPDLRRIGA
jgi:hypothetical protein